MAKQVPPLLVSVSLPVCQAYLIQPTHQEPGVGEALGCAGTGSGGKKGELKPGVNWDWGGGGRMHLPWGPLQGGHNKILGIVAEVHGHWAAPGHPPLQHVEEGRAVTLTGKRG